MHPLQAVYTIWDIWVISWIAASLWTARTVGRAGQLVYYVPVLAGGVMLFFFSPLTGPLVLWPTDNVLGWIMVGVEATGFAFAWWARLTLGTLWSGQITRKEGHRVVDAGPYGIVRHPIYTGIILAAFATATVKATALALAGAVIMSFGWYLKARIEERFLTAELGESAYRAYAARVPMLIPFSPV
jgi:protein-S-isoprenylcysteine O-methyltransferase Ste14